MEKITKSSVDFTINNEGYLCEYRMNGETENHVYQGCAYNLSMILHERSTRVQVADKDCPDYREGYRTIVMKAPCMSAVILLRIEE